MHISHIQKHAPGPPIHTAVETPTILPVPTREAVDIMSAWNDDTVLPDLSSEGSSRSLHDSLNKRSWTNFVLNEKYRPAAVITIISTGKYKTESAEFKKSRMLCPMHKSPVYD
jgi:hypothetical protein